MTYLRGVLGGVAALLVTLFGYEFPGVSGSKATGIAVLVMTAKEALFSPWFWVIAALLFLLLQLGGSAAERSESFYSGCRLREF